MILPSEAEQQEFYETFAEKELHKILDVIAGKEKWRIEKTKDFSITIHVGYFSLDLYFGNVYAQTTKLVLASDKQRIVREFLKRMVSQHAMLQQTVMSIDWNKVQPQVIPRLRSLQRVFLMEKNLASPVHLTRQTVASARPARCTKLAEDFVTTYVLDTPTQYMNIFDEMGQAWKQARDSGELAKLANTYIKDRVRTYLKSKGKKEGSLFSWRVSDSGDWIVPRDSVIKSGTQLLSWLLFVCSPLEIVSSLPASVVSNTKENGFVLFPVHDFFPLIVRACDEKAMVSAYIELNQSENEGEPKLSMLMIAQTIRKVLPPEFSAGFVDPDPTPRSCANCSSQLDLKFCSGCKSVSCCSAACQKADWKKHKQVCQQLAQEKKQQKK